MMAPEQNRILTVLEAAEIARCSAQTIYDAVRAKELRHGRMGRGRGHIRISERALHEWLFGGQGES